MWNSGGNAYAPGGTTLSPPNSGYGSSGYGEMYPGQSQAGLYPGSPASVADNRAYGATQPATSGNFDQYRAPAAAGYGAANSTHYPPPAGAPSLNTPQISRNATQQPFDTRLTGGTSLPAGSNVLGATGVLPPGTLPPGIQSPNAEKPWGPLLFVTFALFFSIGGNLYLAYTALEFHSRYRNAIERLRSAARSA